MGPTPEQAKKSIEKDLNAYRELRSVAKSKEMDTFLDLLIKTAAEKMVWSFIGDNIKSYDDYLKVRGEIVSYLFGVQEVRGADVMVKHLESQLKTYYTSSTS